MKGTDDHRSAIISEAPFGIGYISDHPCCTDQILCEKKRNEPFHIVRPKGEKTLDFLRKDATLIYVVRGVN